VAYRLAWRRGYIPDKVKFGCRRGRQSRARGCRERVVVVVGGVERGSGKAMSRLVMLLPQNDSSSRWACLAGQSNCTESVRPQGTN